MIMKKKLKKTLITCKKTVGVLLVCLMCVIPAKTQEYSKRMVKSYHINNSTTVDVFNKYGKVHVITWDKDSVRFEIDLKLQASNEQKLAKLKSTINFEFTGTEYYVIAKTKIGSGSETVLGDIKDMAGTIISSENQVTIDYVVMVPKYVNLKLENKFGDVYIDDFEGNLNLTLSYGELKANSLNGNTAISLSSGDASVNYVDEGKITISYSDFQIKNAGKLNVDSRSSKVTINKIDNLKLMSRRDKFNLPEISELTGESYFTDFTIGNLGSELNYTLKYGNLSVEKIFRTFSFINIVSEYTDLDLIFERGSSYEIDLSHHKDVILTYPKQLGELETKIINEEEKQYLTYGNIGTSVKSKIKISAPRKCTINIIHR